MAKILGVNQVPTLDVDGLQEALARQRTAHAAGSKAPPAFGLRFDTQFNREIHPLLLRFMADFVPRTANDLVEYSRIWQRLVDLNKERRELLFKFEKGDLDALEEARQIMQQSLK